MAEYIEIEPINIIKEIVKFKIDVPLIMLNLRCLVRVLCYDSNDKLIHTYEFMLEKPDYDMWLKDEDLISYVCQKYNFSPLNIIL